MLLLLCYSLANVTVSWRIGEWFSLCPLAVPRVAKSTFAEQLTSKRRCFLRVPRQSMLSSAGCSWWLQDAPAPSQPGSRVNTDLRGESAH